MARESDCPQQKRVGRFRFYAQLMQSGSPSLEAVQVWPECRAGVPTALGPVSPGMKSRTYVSNQRSTYSTSESLLIRETNGRRIFKIVSVTRTPSCKDARRNAMLRHDQALKEGMDEVAKAGFRAGTERTECESVLP